MPESTDPALPAPDQMIRNLGGSLGELSVESVLIHMVIAAGLALLLGLHFRRFGSTFANRSKFSAVLPAVAMATCLIIAVVKGSLALSLGLVGALSIVRFRTPIKEPEELVYLFMTIAVGLSLGAGYAMLAATGTLVFLVVLTLRSRFARGSRYPNLYLNIAMDNDDAGQSALSDLMAVVSGHAPKADMRRFDVDRQGVQATIYLDCDESDRMVNLQQALLSRYPNASMTFVEQSGIPGV